MMIRIWLELRIADVDTRIEWLNFLQNIDWSTDRHCFPLMSLTGGVRVRRRFTLDFGRASHLRAV